MSDLIRINQLEVHSRIGVPDEERRQPQRLLVSLDLKVRSLKSAALTDDLATTVDYAQVCERVQTLAADRPRRLIETLAEEIAGAVLKDFPHVREVSLELEKFILPQTRSVAVRLKRKRTAKEEKARLRAGSSQTPPVSGHG